MKNQTEMMLVDFDWDREISTCDPSYYKWTQKLFLLMLEHGLAYKKRAEINWDPVDQTVLANEQVDAEGRSWRSGAIVEKKLLEQWFLGITRFAPDLKADLDILTEWPSHVKSMQRNWIGESKGCEVVFDVTGSAQEIKVFTTRPDTIFSVQYVALSVDHPLVEELGSRNIKEKAKELSGDSKKGILLPNVSVKNPIDGSAIPVLVAPYVLGTYGHGAVMGCPAHDTRDYEFFKENFGDSPVEPTVGDGTIPFTEKGILNGLCGSLSGMTSDEACQKIAHQLHSANKGGPHMQYKIRDWLISRQRYWGTPIPIVYCDSCGTVPVPDEDLPVELPKLDKPLLTKGGSPLANIAEFVNCKCPKCDKPAKRETDTMDTFMDSSWYYFRYLDPKNAEMPFSKESANNLMPVDMYIGGVEHAILHLLYARFVGKFFHSIGYWTDSDMKGEPLKRLVTQGMVQGKTYSHPMTGKFLTRDDIDDDGFVKGSGISPNVSYEKMSKSKYNGADPAECIEKHGIDATRAHILFQAPVNEDLNWDEDKITGVVRWIRKVIKLSESCTEKATRNENAEIHLHNSVQKYISSITDSLQGAISLNTVIADYMKLTNALASSLGSVDAKMWQLSFEKLLKVMAPVTPCVAEEAYELMCKKLGKPWRSILDSDWPSVETEIRSQTTKVNVVVNGKMRFVYEAGDVKVDDDEFVAQLLKTPGGEKWLGGQRIKKIIRKPKVISFVV